MLETSGKSTNHYNVVSSNSVVVNDSHINCYSLRPNLTEDVWKFLRLPTRDLNTVTNSLTSAVVNHNGMLLSRCWVNIAPLEPYSFRSLEYMAIQWHSAPFPLTPIGKYGCCSAAKRGGGGELLCNCGTGLHDEAFEVDWAWWMLIDDTVRSKLHNELVAQVVHTSANRVWLSVLHSSVHV